jgi:glucoamylase
MPLVWAHAEFIKLIVSSHLGHPVDRPRAVWRRYQGRRPIARHAFWWPHAPIRTFQACSRLAIALPRPAIVHWGNAGWQNISDEPTHDSGLGFHVASLDVAGLPPKARVEFTWRWQDTDGWHGQDYELAALPAENGSAAHDEGRLVRPDLGLQTRIHRASP